MSPLTLIAGIIGIVIGVFVTISWYESWGDATFGEEWWKAKNKEDDWELY